MNERDVPHSSPHGPLVRGMHIRLHASEVASRLEPAEGFDAAQRVNDIVGSLTRLVDDQAKSAQGIMSFSDVKLMVNSDINGQRTTSFALSPGRQVARVVVHEAYEDPAKPEITHGVTFGYQARRTHNTGYIRRIARPVHRVEITTPKGIETKEIILTDTRLALPSRERVPSPTGIGIATGWEISDIELDTVTQHIKTDVMESLFEMEREKRAKLTEPKEQA